MKANSMAKGVRRGRTIYLLLCAASISGLSVCPRVNAQSADAERPVEGLEEVVVTATRRAENLQNVGISISALDSKQLSSANIGQTTDIVAQVPGLQFNQFSPSITVFNLRGVSQNDFGDQLEPPVAVYIDDAYVATMGGAGVPAFDLDRVEVLRGPQGTQFGRNATGGLIHYVSKRPTKSFEGFLDTTAGSEGLFRTEGAVGGPISDRVQFRAAGSINRSHGYVKNDIGPDIGGQHNYSLRGQLAFQPTDNLDILFLQRYSKNDEVGIGYTSAAATTDVNGLGRLIGPNENPLGTCNGCDLNGYRPNSDPFKVSNNDVGRFNRAVSQTQLRVEWKVGGMDLSSITDFQRMAKDANEDTDGAPITFLKQTYTQRLRQFSEELKLSGNSDRLKWLAGLYYLRWRSGHQGAVLTSEAASLGVSPDAPYITGYGADYETKSWSIFAQGDYHFTDKLTAVVGARYVEDKKTDDYVGFDNFGSSLIFNPSVTPLATLNWRNYSARIGLNYQATEDTLFYVSYNRGIKGPNFSAPSFFPFPPEDIPHHGETLHAFEAGMKTTFAENRARLNVGAFYYDYRDYQAFLFVDVVNRIINRDARAYGLEAEFTVLPAEGLTLSGGLSLMDSKVKDVPYPSGIGTENPKLPQAPGASAHLMARYEHPIAGRLKGAFQVDATYTGNTYFSVLSAPVDYEAAHTVANARISLSDSDDRWEVAVFVKNLSNEVYRVYSADVSAFGYRDSVYAQKRWYGAQVRFNFGH